MRTLRAATSLPALALAAATGCHLAAPAAAATPEQACAAAGTSVAGTSVAGAQAAGAEDPAVVHLKILRKLDAQIDAAAARAHTEARLMVDEVMPIAFLGMVAEPEQGVLRVTQIYRGTGAESCGLRVGDVIVEFAGRRIGAKSELYQEIRFHPPGETVELRVLRDGRELVLHPELGRRWQEDEEDEEQYGDIAPAPFTSRGLPVTLDFRGVAPGVAPASLEQVLGGIGEAPKFVVVRDGAESLLRQENVDSTGIRFPMALVREVDADDVVARVRFRLVGGAQDRTAGIVLRYQDPANYLVARANAVEGDLRIFRAVNGLRRTLPGGVAPIRIDDDRWHVLEFRVHGPEVSATLDGAITVASHDTYYAHGRVGLWTKSDSLTEFDDLRLEAPTP